MKKLKYFRDLFESVPDYWKIVILRFLLENDVDILNECGFLKKYINCLCSEFKNILMERYQHYLKYNKNEEESIIKQTLNT